MSENGRRPIVAGNWKMNNSLQEAQALAEQLRRSLDGIAGIDVLVAPPFTALATIARTLTGSPIEVAGQNLYWEARGAYTGEISPGMLLDAGATYAIIGHSERRQYFSETDETVNRKTKAALAAGLKPIVCVGERLSERQNDQTHSVIERQMRGALAGLTEAQATPLVIAYEPVWAIGTGVTATPEQAQDVHALIRGLLRAMLGEVFAQTVRIQYGGSVTPDNIDGLMAKPDVDGALVGGASLKAEPFTRIVRYQPA